MLQRRLVRLLEASLNPSIHGAEKEFPFRPARENEVWVADIALFNLAFAKQTPGDEYFYGVPDIVIEVLSPSNTASEMLDRETICLRNGGKEFWLVDPNRKSVKVVRADGYSRVYFDEDVIVSDALGGNISVSEIFKG